MQHYVAYFNAYWKNKGREWINMEKAGLVKFDRITVPFERPGLKFPDARKTTAVQRPITLLIVYSC